MLRNSKRRKRNAETFRNAVVIMSHVSCVHLVGTLNENTNLKCTEYKYFLNIFRSDPHLISRRGSTEPDWTLQDQRFLKQI
jgi:hypothetical protein